MQLYAIWVRVSSSIGPCQRSIAAQDPPYSRESRLRYKTFETIIALEIQKQFLGPERQNILRVILYPIYTHRKKC